MIHAMTPFRADKNLGRAYNDAMALLPDDAWVCFMDHDMMFTTPGWNHQLQEAIDFMPDAGAFTAVTNRIASPWQRIGDRENNDIAAHRRFGRAQAKTRTLLDITDTKGFGGVVLCTSKRAWADVGGFADGLGCVDHSLHFKLRDKGYRIWLIEGLYVFHWRHFGEEDPTSHAPKAPNCQCRGPEPMPNRRIVLP